MMGVLVIPAGDAKARQCPGVGQSRMMGVLVIGAISDDGCPGNSEARQRSGVKQSRMMGVLVIRKPAVPRGGAISDDGCPGNSCPGNSKARQCPGWSNLNLE